MMPFQKYRPYNLLCYVIYFYYFTCLFATYHVHTALDICTRGWTLTVDHYSSQKDAVPPIAQGIDTSAHSPLQMCITRYRNAVGFIIMPENYNFHCKSARVIPFNLDLS